MRLHARRGIIGAFALAVTALLLTPVAAQAATMSGTVRSYPANDALSDVSVDIYADSGGVWVPIDFTYTRSDGTWSVPGLSAGNYRVGFNAYSENPGLAPVFYRAKTTLAGGTTVVLPSGGLASVDATMPGTPASIDGLVADESNSMPLAGIAVTAYRFDGLDWVVDAWTFSIADGTFALAALPDGTYRVGFEDPEGKYAAEFHRDASSITDALDMLVQYPSSASVFGSLSPASPVISGSVVSTSGAPLAGMEVAVYAYDESDEAWLPVRVVWSTLAGNYSVFGLPLGVYRVGAHDPQHEFEQAFYQSASKVESATSIETTTAGVVGDVDMVLGRAHADVVGSVIDRQTAKPLSGCQVDAFTLGVGAEAGMWVLESFGVSDVLGRYEIRGLPAGTYRIGFNVGSASLPAYSAQFFAGAASIDVADPVVTGEAGSVPVCNGALEPRHVSLQGTIFDLETGEQAPKGLTVAAYGSIAGTWTPTAHASTASDGSYAFHDLPAGVYRVGVVDALARWRPGFSERAPSIASARNVAVADSGSPALADVYLQRALPSVIGRLTGDGTPDTPSGVAVTAYAFDDLLGLWSEAAVGSTAPDGSFELYGLDGKIVRLAFADTASPWVPEVWADEFSVDNGRDVYVPDSGGVDIGVAHVQPSAVALSGAVTSSGGSGPLGGALVLAYAWDVEQQGWVVRRTATADADGAWVMYSLPDPEYRLVFRAGDGYVPEVHADVPLVDAELQGLLSSATPVSVGEVVNAQLDAVVPAVQGVVTDAVTGEPLEGVRVSALAATSELVRAEALTDSSGVYRLTNLAPGAYRVAFDDARGVGGTFRYRTEYFDDASSLAQSVSLSFDGSTPITASAALVRDEAVAPAVSFPTTVTASRAFDVSILATDNPGGSGIERVVYRLDGAQPVEVPAGNQPSMTAVVRVRGEGGHTLEAWTVDRAGNVSAHRSGVYSIGPSVNRVVQAGDRYDSAAATSRESYPGWAGVTDVILASGEDRAAADPLAAAGLAWAYPSVDATPAPVLLTAQRTTPAALKVAMRDIVSVNGTVTVHVVGGGVSVPAARIADVRAYVKAQLGLTDEQVAARIQYEYVQSAGDRFSLAAAIATRMVEVRGAEMNGQVIVVNGADPAKFFDALAASPIAAHRGIPILLVSANAVPPSTLQAMNELGFRTQDRYVIGGTKTVGTPVFTALGIPLTNRIAGSDRYSLAVNVADTARAKGWLGNRIVGVSAKLPDALVGGPMVGGQGGPLLLVNSTNVPAATDKWFLDNAPDIELTYVFGGPKSVSDAVVNRLASIVN